MHHDARPFNFQPLSFTTYLPILTSIHDSSLVYYRHKPSIPYSVYFLPNALLKRLSLMPQLEILSISHNSDKSRREMERKLLPTTITTRITLPNLRRFGFQVANAYLEALLPWITMPLLERLRVYFFNEPTYSIPHLQQLMGTRGNLRLKYARFTFYDDHVGMIVYPNKEAKMYTLDISLIGRYFDWQVDSIAQVCRMLRTVLFEVEHLVLDYERHNVSLLWGAVAHRTHWRELLGTFDKAKTLYLRFWLVDQLASALQPGEEESFTELLPELQELTYLAVAGTSASCVTFAGFLDARQKAGRPVTVVRRGEPRFLAAELLGSGAWCCFFNCPIWYWRDCQRLSPLRSDHSRTFPAVEDHHCHIVLYYRASPMFLQFRRPSRTSLVSTCVVFVTSIVFGHVYISSLRKCIQT